MQDFGNVRMKFKDFDTFMAEVEKKRKERDELVSEILVLTKQIEALRFTKDVADGTILKAKLEKEDVERSKNGLRQADIENDKLRGKLNDEFKKIPLKLKELISEIKEYGYKQVELDKEILAYQKKQTELEKKIKAVDKDKKKYERLIKDNNLNVDEIAFIKKSVEEELLTARAVRKENELQLKENKKFYAQTKLLEEKVMALEVSFNNRIKATEEERKRLRTLVNKAQKQANDKGIYIDLNEFRKKPI